MKAGVLEEVERLVVKDVPDPQPDEGSVILRVKLCSICGSDLRTYHYGHSRVTLPQILGHEIAGQIEAVGEEVKNYRLGDRVAVTPRISCGECFYCQKGQYTYCLNNLSIGYQLPGGYAECLSVPRRGVEFGVVNKIPDGVSFEAGALAEPLACCLRAQRASAVSRGDAVVIVGGGPVGIIHARLARVNGAGRVILVERETGRLERVDLGSIDRVVDSERGDVEPEILALTGGGGADVVIVACSSAEAQEQALSLARKGGRVNFFGGLPPGRSEISIDSNLLHYSEISLQGTHGSAPDDNREALDMLARELMKVDDLITHRFPLDLIGDAFLFAESRKGMHVAVLP
jgi:L-iditol 2-dehydrogenase